MKSFRCHAILLVAFFWAAPLLLAANNIPDEVRQQEAAGNFKRVAVLLQPAIADTNTPAAERRQLAFELDRLDRIRLDYPLTHAALKKKLQASVRDFTDAEFDQWLAEKRFDVRMIDGEERFMISSVPNLFWRYPELNPRRTPPKNEDFQLPMWQGAMAIRQAAEKEHTPYVLPKKFDVTMTVTVDAGAAPDGETIRAWLPVPRTYPYQDDFELVSSSSPVIQLAPETSPIRSAYLEQPATDGEPTVFSLHYHYTTKGVSFDIDPDKVPVFAGSNEVVGVFTKEAPHVVFTPELRALSQTILGGETNSARAAKKIYEWIGANIKYSFATEYSTIPNISEYTRSHGYGDCGEEALFFITLCRLNNIPARWQSGWDTFPGAEDIHDWTEIYLAPYGWVPVDPFMSTFATQYAGELSPDQRRELRDFYFGGRSQWRMAANANHSRNLHPAKQSFRSDDVDFQRGELECDGTDIYFNHYHYAFTVKEIPVQ
ncbi:MAG TPA: transglutaminase-like domain-containing protein [Candidatus Sulfotelmatobacter sp.]|nr:transglutaminase-like domain-containing protein [Candidatus Sulfotelmatobacter sp.]